MPGTLAHQDDLSAEQAIQTRGRENVRDTWTVMGEGLFSVPSFGDRKDVGSLAGGSCQVCKELTCFPNCNLHVA